jgi:hypothetical protein
MISEVRRVLFCVLLMLLEREGDQLDTVGHCFEICSFIFLMLHSCPR